MNEKQIKKGFFRLWLVFSACWILYGGFDLLDERIRLQKELDAYTYSAQDLNESWERKISRSLPVMTVPPIATFLLFFVLLWIFKGFRNDE